MSWLTDYLTLTKRQESPEVFHMWCGITTLAAALGRRVWMDRRSGGVTRYQIYPGQIWTVLVGGSGRVRKTTAISPTKQLLKSINKRIVSGKSSPEAFLDQLDGPKGGDPNSILIESELTVFISKTTYAEPLIDVLNKLYDYEDTFEFHTRGGGKISIPTPALTLFGATTPENIGERFPPSAHGSGFMSRVIFVFAKVTDRLDSLSDIEDTDVDAKELAETRAAESRLRTELKQISTLAGPFTFTQTGKRWFDNFYRQWVNSPMGQGEGYPARRPDHMLRIAMTIAASKNMRLEVDEGSLKSADALLTLAEAEFDKAFAFVGTQYARDRQRIIDFVASRAGKCKTSDLYAAMYIYFPNSEVLQRTLRLLTEANVLACTNGIWSLVGYTFP
jgi:hypothetical protein